MSILHVARGGSNGGSYNGTSINVPVTAQVGDTVVVHFACTASGPGVSSVTDNATPPNTYVRGPVQNTNVHNETWSSLNVANPPTTITIHYSATEAAACVEIYTGVVGTGNTGSASSTSSNPAVTIVTQSPDNWVAMCGGVSGSPTWSAVSPNEVWHTASSSIKRGVVTAASLDAGPFATAGSNTVVGKLSASALWGAVGLELLSTLPAPTVVSVTPNSGTTVGGTPVTIAGTNFAPGATVTFGGIPATNVVVVNSAEITCNTPADVAGPVTVQVTVGTQSGSLANGYTYVTPPPPGSPVYSYMCGFELGNGFAEAFGYGGQPGSYPTLSTTIVHGGKYSMECNPTNSYSYLSFVQEQGATAPAYAQPIFCSVRFYLYAATLPNVSTIIYTGQAVVLGNLLQTLALNPDGTFTVYDGGNGLASSTLAISTGAWHQISLAVNPYSGTNSIALYVDGVLWASLSSSSGNTGILNQVYVGAVESVAGGYVTCDLYFDDILWDNGANGAVIIGPGSQVLLKPTADSSIGNWKGGAGGTTNLWQAVSSIPPTGSKTPSDTSQIRDNSSSTPSDYTAVCESYTAEGIPTGATINAVTAFVNDEPEVTSSAILGTLWIVSNPAQTVPPSSNNFMFGNVESNAGGLANFPLGWFSQEGPVSTNPVIDPATAPTVTVAKVTPTSQVCDVDFLGIYVDYL